MKLIGIGLEAPPGFPVAPVNAVYALLEERHATHSSYPHFAAAWHAMAYRFAAAVDSANRFKQLLSEFGATPPASERYLQEDSLFHLFSCCFSVFECAAYGIFAVGSIAAPLRFPIAAPADQQRISPRTTCDKFQLEFPLDPLTLALVELLADKAFQQMRDARNLLTHRTAPGRTIFASADGTEPPSIWKLNDMPLNEALSESALFNLSRLATRLLTPVEAFVAARLQFQ